MLISTQRQQTETNFNSKCDGQSNPQTMDGILQGTVQLQTKTDASILRSGDDVENRETGDSPMYKEEIEKALRMLKDGKSPGVDNHQRF